MKEREVPEQLISDTPPSVFDTAMAKKTKKKWLKPAILIGSVLIISGVLWFFVFVSDNDETNDEATSHNQHIPSATAPQPTNHPAELIYAYKEDKKTLVRSLNWADKSKTDIFDFSEATEINNSGNFWSGLGPSVDYDPINQQFVYIDTTGLKTFDRSSTEQTKLITKVENFSSEQAAPDWSIEFAGLSGPGVFDIYIPEFSPNADLISYRRAHYEGSSVGVFDLASNSDLTAGGTFRYVDDSSPEPLSFAVADQNTVFGDIRQYADHFLEVKGASVSGTAFSPDGKYAAFSLMIKTEDELSIGPDSKINLLLVDTASLEYTILGSGVNYTDSLIFSPDSNKIYAVNNDPSVNGKYSIEAWSVADKNLVQKYDVKPSFAVDGVYDSVDLYSFDKVYASVKTKIGTDYNVVVVDVDAQRQLANFLVDRVSAYAILFAKQ